MNFCNVDVMQMFDSVIFVQVYLHLESKLTFIRLLSLARTKPSIQLDIIQQLVIYWFLF